MTISDLFFDLLIITIALFVLYAGLAIGTMWWMLKKHCNTRKDS